ncbi:MAG: HAMP domain-containing sensor histidine kinase [Actinomycetota bacterium]
MSLRTQLVVLGLVATLIPLGVLLLVVFGVEEDETVDTTSDGEVIDAISESGVSPWIPITAVALAIAATGLVWWWAKRAVDPIERMTELTDDVQAGSLDRRLGLDGASVEIRALGESFDRMLDRLAAASAVERRLIEDASHELRTPLAALAARLEVASRRTDPSDIADDIARCEADVDRLRNTLDALLASTRTRQSELEQVDNDLVPIVQRLVDRQRLVSPSVPITVETPGSVVIGVDGPSVERAVANLVANAVEHGGGSPVSVDVVETDGAVTITVTDRGPGIAPDRLPTIFDRYSGQRHGLGLALVKQVAEAYGDVEIESPIDDGRGCRAVLRLRR